MTRLGLLGVSSDARTGYGRVTRELAKGLIDAGHEVYSIAHGGGEAIVWGGKKQTELGDGRTITTLLMDNPLTNPHNATAMTKTYCEKYRLDFLIATWDGFALRWMKEVGTPFVDYVPVDGGMTPRWAGYCEGATKIVAMSRFGFDEFRRFYPPSQVNLIEHGVDTEAFQPMEADKGTLRDQINADEQKKINKSIPRDAFLFTYTAANYGHRKGFPVLLETFSKFVKKHPDARLYLHTNRHTDSPAGYALEPLIDQLGLKDYVYYPSYDPIIEPVEDSDFRRLYAASDVFISTSMGEGFCLPLIEAQACGLSAICPRNSAQSELVEGHGYLAECVDDEVYSDYPLNIPTLQKFRPVNQKSLLEQMELAYSDETLRIEYGKASRQFALGYAWPKLIPKWLRLIKEVSEEVQMWSEIKASIKAGP